MRIFDQCVKVRERCLFHGIEHVAGVDRGVENASDSSRVRDVRLCYRDI